MPGAHARRIGEVPKRGRATEPPHTRNHPGKCFVARVGAGGRRTPGARGAYSPGVAGSAG